MTEYVKRTAQIIWPQTVLKNKRLFIVHVIDISNLHAIIIITWHVLALNSGN